MLHLSRKVGESIMIDDTEIIIMKISCSTVQIGVKSNKAKVYRKEVYDSIAQENAQAQNLIHSTTEILSTIKKQNARK